MRPGHIICLLLCGASFAAEKPNILFIAIDDLRPELGCYGSPQVKTPHIDRLASQGMRFDRAYCQVPICMGSRASLLTGILPTPTRFHGDTRADKDMPNAATLPQTFKTAGYTSYSGGKSEMLYDLEKDPLENKNVVAQPEYRETVNKMKARLKQRQQEAAGITPTPVK